MTYSIVIPVYHGENTVEPLFKDIQLFFQNKPYSYEVIFVWDCGDDNSWQVLQELKEKNEESIKLIHLARNFGQHNALICGFEYAQGDFIITMDEDLQHCPADIAQMINRQKEGDFDVVYGKYEELKHSSYRNLTSRVFKKVIALGIPELHNDYSAFRLIKSDTAKACVEMHNSYTFLDGYLSWITSNVGVCIVSHNERLSGSSSYNTKKLINHSINVFVTFSDLPIRLLSKFSIVLLSLTFLFAIYILLRKLIVNDLALGYPSLILSICFGVGVILLALGVIGEYIYRINLKTTKRPNYIVKITM